MIRELITYFTSKTSAEARAFGHLYESIALIEREKRCKSYWLSHRSNSKNFIKESIRFARSFDRVLVLGSGPLHEIPIEELAAAFKHVDLVDVVHLKETKKACAHLQNVHFIEADVTELEETILKERRPVNIAPTRFLNDHYDLVISANLLSQLSYHLRNFLEKKTNPKLSSDVLDKFAYVVTLNHYQYLQKFTCPVILITDVETVLSDKQDKIVETDSPYINFDLPAPLKEWWWNVAPIPEYSKEISIKMKVAGFVLNV